MKKQFRSIGLVLGYMVIVAMSANAQVSGVPGDGVPDFYYFASEGLTATTSFGSVSRPAGTMLLDTDGYNVVAMLIGGSNVSTAPACDLCNNQQLPTANLAGDTFTVGFAGGSSQWIRTAPLSGRGFLGVIGTGYVDSSGATVNSWPANFPPFLTFTTRAQGLANYGAGLTDASFTKVFNDGTSEALWSVRVAADTGAPRFTNVTVLQIPEPTSGILGVMGLVVMGAIRRRIG